MKMLIISNMYPDEGNPSYGVFVKNFEDIIIKNNIKSNKIIMTKSKNKKLFKYIEYYFNVFKAIIFNDYDIIYVHYAAHNSIPIILASKFKKINLFVNVHGSDVMTQTKIQGLLKPSTKKMLNIANRVITPSEYFKDFVSEEYFINREKIFVYPSGGVDTNIFYKFNPNKVEDLKINYGFNKDDYIIGFIGRININKGWNTFIRAISNLDLITNDRIKVIIVGDGEDRENLIEKLEDNNLLDKVRLFPLVGKKELSNIYNILDVLCFPTFKESLGLVAIEALSVGTPIIGSDIRPVNDYIRNGYNGFLFEKDNHLKLKARIKEHYSLNKEEKVLLINNALKSSEKFSVKNTEKILIDLINKN